MSLLALGATIFTLASPIPAHTDAINEATGRVQLPAARVTVVNQDCPEYEAGSRVSCVYMRKPNIIYTTQPDDIVFLHELGHVFDFSRTMMPWQRLAFRVIMRDFKTPWYNNPDRWDVWGLSEKFADAYAACAMGLTPAGEWRPSGYRYMPTVEQHRQVCKMISPRAVT